MPKIFNLGCKLNQYEGFCLLQKFADIKDLVIVNTCCVTKEAEIKSLRKFRQSIKRYPNSKIIATGCACRIYPEKFSAAYQVIDNVQRNYLIKGILPAPEKSKFFLKIEDGCNSNCTYCIVAKVRNKIGSKTINSIKKEIQWAISLDYKEIVLVGANIGLYGIDMGLHLTDLLQALRDIPDLPRIRLSSIEPKFIDSELIKGLKDLSVCRHFHIPIQSADDHILSRMGRGYDAAHLKRSLDLISRNFDDIAIGGDIIVGFPGEGEEEFLNTYKFIESNSFTHLHVFPYSPRPGTEAYDLGDPVLQEEKKRRLWELKNLIAEKNYQFRKNLLGKTFDIIVEKHNGFASGLTDNYIRVEVNSDYDKNTLIKIKINEVSRNKTFGSI